MSEFNKISNFPDCPDFISHWDKFEYTDCYKDQKQYGRFRASFVSSQTGTHKFFAVLNDAVQIYIEMNPTGERKILDAGSATIDDWGSRYAKFVKRIALFLQFFICQVFNIAGTSGNIFKYSLYTAAVSSDTHYYIAAREFAEK